MTEIVDKLIYFSKIGEYHKINKSELTLLLGKIKITKRKKKFKFDKLSDEKYIIWRVK